MSDIPSRVEHPGLRAKVVPVEEAARLVKDRMTLAVSGFTKAGEPKAFLRALAARLAAEAPETRIALYSGASLSEEVEGPLSSFIGKRGPYMSSAASRKRIHAREMEFADAHLSQFARDLMYGFYGDIDLAVVEVSRIRPDGSVILTSSVGIGPEALRRAKAVVLEVNTAGPDFTGFHDIVVPAVYPRVGWPIPITNVSDRVGMPWVELDPSKVAAVVESRTPDFPVEFKPASETDRRIAANVIDFLVKCRDWLHWGERPPPIQSGVGNIGNAVVGGLYDSPFRKIRFWTEVFQDGMMRFIEDDDRFECGSACALSLSSAGKSELARLFARTRDKIVLRPMWMSNSPEIITRLFVIAMNTPIEVDIYGHVNSTKIDGSRIVNGLGGSGDFFRNAYVSIAHAPSVRRLRDGRVVSCVLPYVRHVDHTEHDIKCIVTEQGYALNTAARSPYRRALDVIDSCAHPHFRPLLRDYLKIGGGGDEPRPTDLHVLEGFWKEYDAACRSFPAAGAPARE
jgi:acetyl-CoA hydrolase